MDTPIHLFLSVHTHSHKLFIININKLLFKRTVIGAQKNISKTRGAWASYPGLGKLWTERTAQVPAAAVRAAGPAPGGGPRESNAPAELRGSELQGQAQR